MSRGPSNVRKTSLAVWINGYGTDMENFGHFGELLKDAWLSILSKTFKQSNTQTQKCANTTWHPVEYSIS